MDGSIHLFERLPQVDSVPQSEKQIAQPSARARPLVGLIRNVRSHRNEGRQQAEVLGDNVLLATPHRRSELAGVLADFAAQQVDYLAIDGGDGTVRDVLTCGAGVFGESWPTVIILPGGKTNALALDLGVPTDWSFDDALTAIENGRLVHRHPLVIAQRDNERAQVRGFAMGAGVFNQVIALGQRSHDLGAFNHAVVAITGLWSVGQAILGFSGNKWRQGTPMRIQQSDGTELPHLGGLPASERYMLFASTLQKYPAGLDPFHDVDGPLQVAVLDNARRRLLFGLPAMLRGSASAKTRRRGYHAFGDTAVDLDLSQSFILDGEAFPAGQYRVSAGPKLRFVVP
ncbi:diacylglycerol/lipid kinase family protein [Aurantiacibacter rhizosphaerae]|uniref:Diacylglycerol kinase n=1 Tax=Aurantiacibacter rhizosphaerae TaxID=2691582 RepID=A0A844X9Y7_9SPHN|nr:diacylglycerol kinase family protein [Aurantiacibacter rhizosphaerae]MWV26458.1 diacylglycerol kinase [Aurantiacibacter rhizosphaerae]